MEQPESNPRNMREAFHPYMPTFDVRRPNFPAGFHPENSSKDPSTLKPEETQPGRYNLHSAQQNQPETSTLAVTSSSSSSSSPATAVPVQSHFHSLLPELDASDLEGEEELYGSTVSPLRSRGPRSPPPTSKPLFATDPSTGEMTQVSTTATTGIIRPLAVQPQSHTFTHSTAYDPPGLYEFQNPGDLQKQRMEEPVLTSQPMFQAQAREGLAGVSDASRAVLSPGSLSGSTTGSPLASPVVGEAVFVQDRETGQFRRVLGWEDPSLAALREAERQRILRQRLAAEEAGGLGAGIGAEKGADSIQGFLSFLLLFVAGGWAGLCAMGSAIQSALGGANYLTMGFTSGSSGSFSLAVFRAHFVIGTTCAVLALWAATLDRTPVPRYGIGKVHYWASPLSIAVAVLLGAGFLLTLALMPIEARLTLGQWGIPADPLEGQLSRLLGCYTARSVVVCFAWLLVAIRYAIHWSPFPHIAQEAANRGLAEEVALETMYLRPQRTQQSSQPQLALSRPGQVAPMPGRAATAGIEMRNKW